MSLKRKFDASCQSRPLDDDKTDDLLPIDKEIDEEADSTDEELSDSNFEDDVEDDFEKLNLSSDSNEANDIEDENESDEWEDIDSEEEKGQDIVADNDSDYIGSSKGDIEESSSEMGKENSSSSERKEDFKTKSDEIPIKNLPSKLLESSITKAKSKVKLKKRRVPRRKLKNDSTSNKTVVEKNKEPAKNVSKNKQNKTKSSGQVKGLSNKTVIDEYEDDSSDEEDLRNTIGNIPINWYDDYDHLGYGLDSLPIYKPKKGDTLDKFLEKLENPDYGRTVFDKQTGQSVRLSDAHLNLVQRLLSRKVPNPEHNMYAPFPDLYSHEVMEMPLSGRAEHKRSFLPSKFERQKVVRLAYLMRRGLYRKRSLRKNEKTEYYDLWKPRSEDAPRLMGVTDHIPAPKMHLPGHADSYNPAPEYLVSRDDEKGLRGKDMGDRKMFQGFWRKFKSVREIPGYPKTVKERYERLLDLYLAPRKRYRRVVAEAKDFLPKLPDKKDLRPYPTLEAIKFKGHRSIIRTISVHPGGKYLASGSDDHTVRVWEIGTGRCLRTFEVEAAVKKVSWNPNPKLFLLGIAMGTMVVFLNPETYLTDKIVVQQTNAIFREEVDQGDYITPQRMQTAVTWRKPTDEEWAKGYRIVLDHFKEVKEIVWHRQGDYFATLIPEGFHRSVIMHQLSKWRSQLPFQRNKGRVQTVAFNPKQPQLFVVTQSHIRVYDLKRQGLLKKIQANSRWVSCIAVHPGGEHFVIGGYDRRVNWFEMECTKRPHLMRYHSTAVRSISFHHKYPLYASCSDEGRLIVTHAMVYDDWLKDPLIVPLKQLKGHKKFDDLYVLDLAWHPYEPYLLTAGADATIRLWH